MIFPAALAAGYRTPSDDDPQEREILDWIEQVADTAGWAAPDASNTQKTLNTETQN
jgi:hypothetical protein